MKKYIEETETKEEPKKEWIDMKDPEPTYIQMDEHGFLIYKIFLQYIKHLNKFEVLIAKRINYYNKKPVQYGYPTSIKLAIPPDKVHEVRLALDEFDDRLTASKVLKQLGVVSNHKMTDAIKHRHTKERAKQKRNEFSFLD